MQKHNTNSTLFLIVVVFSVIFQEPSLAQSEQEQSACVQENVQKYGRLCEQASTIADVVAALCAPEPLPIAGQGQAAQNYYEIDLARHMEARREALIGILDFRLAVGSAC